MKTRGPRRFNCHRQECPGGHCQGSGPSLHLGSFWSTLGDGPWGPNMKEPGQSPGGQEGPARVPGWRRMGSWCLGDETGPPPPLMAPGCAHPNTRVHCTPAPGPRALRGMGKCGFSLCSLLSASISPTLTSVTLFHSVLFSLSPRPPSPCVSLLLSLHPYLFLLCFSDPIYLLPSLSFSSLFLCLFPASLSALLSLMLLLLLSLLCLSPPPPIEST